MEIVECIKNINRPYKKTIITIGNFDGVHIGHQALFYKITQIADSMGGTSMAITFEPHPVRVLKQKGHPPLITLYQQKIELIASAGIDVLICIPFTKEFASISAKQFVKNLLVKQLGMKAIIVGNDYTFGKNREGNIELLKAYSKKLDFEVKIIDWINVSNGLSGRISSTRIRELVMEGDVETAQKLLGRYYQIRGTVTPGRNRGGKLLGFPTANIILSDELCPKSGVYAVTVENSGSFYKGVANIGYSPTFEDNIFTVEVHLINFNENIYGQKIRVNFVKRIRNEIKFSGISELSEQINKDIRTARKLISI